MSGGAYEYAYGKVLDFAQMMIDGRQSDRDLSEEEWAEYGINCEMRKDFGEFLLVVAEAMRVVEWVDSADMGPPDDEQAIRAAWAKGKGLEDDWSNWAERLHKK